MGFPVHGAAPQAEALWLVVKAPLKRAGTSVRFSVTSASRQGLMKVQMCFDNRGGSVPLRCRGALENAPSTFTGLFAEFSLAVAPG